MSPTSKHTYQLNDRILCSYKGLIYEAKIIEVTTTAFKIHYQGWHKRYDELVPFKEIDSKFKIFTEQALLDAKKAVTDAAKPKNSGKKRQTGHEFRRSESGSRAATPNVSGGSHSLKKMVDKSAAGKSLRDSDAKEQMHIVLPVGLKQILVDDNELINQTKLHQLPSEFTVERIVREYGVSINDVIDNTSEIVVEFNRDKCVTSNASKFITSSQGVMGYFDSLLGYHLLYKFERAQYSEQCERKNNDEEPQIKRIKIEDIPYKEPATKPSSLYGLPHLLRLLSRFDKYLKMAHCNKHITTMLCQAINDFVIYLDKNKDKYFDIKRNYQPSTREYKQSML